VQVARSYSLLIVLSTIWGMAFVAIRRADFELSPVNLTLLRWLIVSACFLAIYRVVVKPKVKLQRQDLPRLLLVAFTSVVVYHLALTSAEKTVDASLAGILISFAPLFIILLSGAVLHEKISGRVWLGLVLAVAGAVTISSPGLSLSGAGAEGPALVVLAALSSATNTVASKPLVGKYGPFAVAAWAAFLGTAMLVPLVSPGLVAQAESLSAVGWASVLYLALLSTVLANLIYYTLVHGQAVSRLGIQLYLVPVVSAAGGILILGEGVGWPTVAGGTLLLLAIAIATRRRP
jgi:drug/metabolite transporter (DMT)-like permease